MKRPGADRLGLAGIGACVLAAVTFPDASGIFGIQIACQQSFVALGQAKVAIFLALLRKVILLIPLILLLPRLGIFENAAFAVFLAEPVADTLAVCTTAAMFFTRFGKLTAGAENT